MLGKLLDGRYRIIQALGTGGFSHTYIAEDTKLYNARCVVKQLKPQANDPATLKLARRLFDSEAKLLHELGSHDQIPQLLAHFEENQDFYLVQQLILGHPLSRELTRGKQWSEDYVINLLQNILQPLAFVHQNNVIHRDIKPPNLIRRHSDGKIVLIDFGAVKQISTQLVTTHAQSSMTVSIGTPGYMPSEQSRGSPKLSSDIYAVGIIGIQALTGFFPEQLQEDPQTAEIMWRHLASVSSELADILDNMVRYDFRERYQSATEALAAVQALATPYVLTQQFTTRTFAPLRQASELELPLYSPPPSVLPKYSHEVSFPFKQLLSVKSPSPAQPTAAPRQYVGWDFYVQWIIASVFGYGGGFFIGFVILGMAGNLASFAFLGLAVGVKQWFVLRRKVYRPCWWWILATILAVFVPFILGMTPDLGHFVLLHGLVVGFAQWLVLRRLVHNAAWWLLVNALGGWIGGFISGAVLVWLLGNPKGSSQ